LQRYGSTDPITQILTDSEVSPAVSTCCPEFCGFPHATARNSSLLGYLSLTVMGKGQISLKAARALGLAVKKRLEKTIASAAATVTTGAIPTTGIVTRVFDSK
jgi:hypothetical protein